MLTPLRKNYAALLATLFLFPLLSTAQTQLYLHDAVSGKPIQEAQFVIREGTLVGFDPETGLLRVTPSGEAEMQVIVAAPGYLSDTLILADPPAGTRFQTLTRAVDRGYQLGSDLQLSSRVQTLDVEALRLPSAGSLYDALSGLIVGGVSRRSSGQPGEAGSLRLRGPGSPLLGGEPLILVDGRPGVPLSDVDVNDVSRIEVLTDLASSARFGASGAHGVVLVHTHRGVMGQQRINFRSQVAMAASPPALDLLDGAASYQAFTQAAQQNGEDLTPFLGDAWVSGQTINPNDLQHREAQARLFRSGLFQNYHLSTQSGSKGTRLYFSGNYLGEAGVVDETGYERLAFTANLDQDISQVFSFMGGVNFTFAQQSSLPTGSAIANEGVIQSALLSLPFQPAYDTEGLGYLNPLQPQVNAPAVIIEGYDIQTRRMNFGAHGQLKAQLTPYLYLLSRAQITLVNEQLSSFLSGKSTFQGQAVSGRGVAQGVERAAVLADNVVSYQRDFGRHHFGGMAAFVYHQHAWNENRGVGENYATEFNPLVSAASNTVGTSNAYTHRKRSFVTGIDYHYANTYFLSVSLRSDASNRFAEGETFFHFPSVSAAWRLSEAGFLRNAKQLDDLKVRLSYGQAGYDGGWTIGQRYAMPFIPVVGATDTMAGIPGLDPDEPFRLDSLPTTSPQVYNARALRPELSTEVTLGLDLSLAQQAITLRVDAYQRNLSDLILPVRGDSSFAYQNAGQMQVRGLDVLLGTRLMGGVGGKLYWRADWLLSLSQAEMGETGGYDDAYFTQGIASFRSGSSPLGFIAPDGTNLGTAWPSQTVATQQTVRWRGWEFRLWLRGSLGQQVLNVNRYLQSRSGDYVNQLPSAAAEVGWSDFVETASYLRVQQVYLGYHFKLPFAQRVQIYVSLQDLLTLTNYQGYDPEASSFGFRGIDGGAYPLPAYYGGGINMTL